MEVTSACDYIKLAGSGSEACICSIRRGNVDVGTAFLFLAVGMWDLFITKRKGSHHAPLFHPSHQPTPQPSPLVLLHHLSLIFRDLSRPRQRHLTTRLSLDNL